MDIEDRRRSVLLRPFPPSEGSIIKEAAGLVGTYSWGLDYPVSPEDEIRKATFHVGAFVEGALVGYANVNCFASPDGHGNGTPWLANAVVRPEWRRDGVFSRLYYARLEYLPANYDTLFVATDNPVVERFVLNRGWRLDRETVDEAGDPCRIYALKSQDLVAARHASRRSGDLPAP